jgi:hypothetical protein
VIEGGIDLGTQLYNNGGDLRQVSLGEVGANFAGGFVTGGLAGFTLGGSLIADVAVGGGASVAGGVVNRSVLQAATGDYTIDPFSENEMAADFAAGLIGGAVGNRVAHRAADLIHAPKVGPYPRKGTNFRRRLAAYNSRVAAQQTQEVKAFAVGTAVSTPITHGLDSWFNSSWFNPPLLPSWQSFLTFGCGCIPDVESTIHY